MRLEKMHSKKFLALACLAFAGFCGCSSDSSSNAPVVGTPLTDSRDGQTYRTVDIGGQIWMAQNLNYNVEGSYCYGDAEAYCAQYGRLYTWATAKDACPGGWHLPSSVEFNALLNSVGAGEKLKSAEGFSAVFAGVRNAEGNFADAEASALFWSSTEKTSSDEAYSLFLATNTTAALLPTYNKAFAFSVRCVQD